MRVLLRWWWLGIPVVLIVLALLTGITIRLMGEADLAAVRREIAAAGQPADYAAWRVTIPPADAERGEALRTAITRIRPLDVRQRREALREALRFTPAEDSGPAAAHAAQARLALDVVMRAAAEPLDELRRVLSGNIIPPLTNIWSLPTDPLDASMWLGNPDNFASSQTQQVACALAVSAERSENPDADLGALRALGRAARAGPLLIDSLVAMEIQPIIDVAHWAEWLKGRASTMAIQAWMEDMADHPESVQRSFVAERVVLSDIVIDDPSLPPAPWWMSIETWVNGPGMAATHQRIFFCLSSTTAIVPFPSSRLPWLGRSFFISIAEQMQECQIRALIADAESRIYRAAALILLHADREPDAMVEARIRPLLDGAPGRLLLGWERLPDRRIRVGVDPRIVQPLPLGRFPFLKSYGLNAAPNVTADQDRVFSGTLEFDLP